MKTLSKTLFATALSVLFLASSATTTFAADPAPLVKTSSIKNINRIWVSGNVKVVLTQGTEPSIIGSDNFDPKLTSVISKGNNLYINSMESQQVTLSITLKDLERIEAYGQSVVVTANNFDVKYLQLFLYQSATAKIKATTSSLYTVVQEDAVLKLNGTSNHSTLVATNMKNIKTTNFVSAKSEAYTADDLMGDKLAILLSK